MLENWKDEEKQQKIQYFSATTVSQQYIAFN